MDKLKHIEHVEDLILNSGYAGFSKSITMLNRVYGDILNGKNTCDLSMKYDGSPSIVYGVNPDSGKFFVATKSAFNKSPKLNYTDSDIEINHGHAIGLVEKLKVALRYLPNIAPKSGVYQGDLMFTSEDLSSLDNGYVSFTPNTITYTADGVYAKAISNAKLGLVTHTQYIGSDLESMRANPIMDISEFKTCDYIFHKTSICEIENLNVGDSLNSEFKNYLNLVESIGECSEVYDIANRHLGDSSIIKSYINNTVISDELPTSFGLRNFMNNKVRKEISKLKTESIKHNKLLMLESELSHIEVYENSYDRLLKIHDYLQRCKNILVSILNQNNGGLTHSINGVKSDPEGFVVYDEGVPSKLVNRKEFAKANMLRFGKK